MINKLITLIVIFLAIPLAFAMDIPINISQTTPTDIAGINRLKEHVTLGIPLKNSDNIQNTSQLTITNNTAQFRVLKRYQDTNNIWWVLVDTQASLNSPKIIHLTDNKNIIVQNNLSEDIGEIIVINTTAAEFKINKSRFNFLDSVKINEKNLVLRGNNGGVEVESEGINYSSIYTKSPNITIEENGPLRTCIKVSGKLNSSQGEEFMGYTLRMHFYYNKTYVKTYFTLRNAYYNQSTKGHPIKRAGIILKTNLTSNQSYVLAEHNLDFIGDLNETKYLFQGYNETFYETYPDNNIREKITPINGTLINNQNYNAYSKGYGEIYDESFGITTIMRWMNTYWPAGIEIQNNSIEIDSLSKRNSIEPIFGWGVWETREILFDFHPTDSNNTELLYFLQYPINGRVNNFSWYRETGAIFGQEEILGINEQYQYHQDNSIEWFEDSRGIPTKSIDMEFRRYYAWASTGGLQSDAQFDNLYNYLRTGYGALFSLGEQSVTHKINHAILHSDNFDYRNKRPSSINNTNNYNSNTYDWAHQFSTSIYLYYFISGNEQVKDSLKDYLEWIDYETEQAGWDAQNEVFGSGDMRCYSRLYRAFPLIYSVLEDEIAYEIAKNMSKLLIVSYDQNLTQSGRNLNRGYLYDSHTDGSVHDFFYTKILGDAIWQNIKLLNLNNSNSLILEDLEDLFLGAAYFYRLELTGSGEDNHTYTEYNYVLTSPNDFEGSHRPALGGFYQAHGYKLTGDTDFLFSGWIDGSTRYTNMYYPDIYQAWERETQVLMYYKIYGNIKTGYINRVNSDRVDLKNDSINSWVSRYSDTYNLTWKIPDSITKYQIKFSNQPLVENLDFNQYNTTRKINGGFVASREYKFNPNQYDNFWAAINIGNEPIPNSIEETQSILINVSKIIEEYNGRYDLIPSDPAFLKYNNTMDYYFAIKYWKDQSCLQADLDSNGTIETSEIKSYVSDWKNGNVLISDLFEALSLWKSG